MEAEEHLVSSNKYMFGLFERVYDYIIEPEHIFKFQRFIVFLSIIGLLVHLIIIGCVNYHDSEYFWMKLVGTNYLSALYTPFSFILFYEVLLLILAISESFTNFISKQYEIISLIVIRDVFKDISHFENFAITEGNKEAFISVLFDMGGGLVLFLFVTVFCHIKSLTKGFQLKGNSQEGLANLIKFKKTIAVFLTFLLFSLAAYSLILWSIETYGIILFQNAPVIDIKRIFYVDMFSVMIFSDLLILLISMSFIQDYRLVFRNAGFVISTILLRFALSIDKPYNVELAMIATFFGILVLGVYAYSVRVSFSHKSV